MKQQNIMKSSKQLQKIPLQMGNPSNFFQDLICFEPVDYRMIYALCDSNFLKNKFDSSSLTDIEKRLSYLFKGKGEKEQLQKYLKNYDHKRKAVQTTYVRGKNKKYGRFYVSNGLGVSMMKKKTRNTLIKDEWIDFDMENCAPVIAWNIASQNFIRHSYIQTYLCNREEMLKEIMEKCDCSRDEAKKLPISLLNGSSFSKWKVASKVTRTISSWDWLNGYIEDVDALFNALQRANKTIWDTARKRKEAEGSGNAMGAFMSDIICEWEVRIMAVATEKIKTSTQILNTMEYIYEYDGFKLRKEKCEEYGTVTEICDIINHFVKEELGFAVVFKDKPIDEYHDVTVSDDTGNDLIVVESDDEALGILYNLFKDKVVCCETTFFSRADNFVWCEGKDRAQSTLSIKIIQLNMCLTTAKGLVEYSKSASKAKQMALMVLDYIRLNACDEWFINSQESNLYRLLFNNGWIDFRDDFFFYNFNDYEFDDSIVFFGKIYQDFYPVDEDDMAYVKDVKKRIFHDTLGVAVGDYICNIIARGLVGEPMKKLILGIGRGNNGKSIISDAISKSLGTYSKTFNAENLSYSEKNKSKDKAQGLRWAMLLRANRLIVSNEMETGVQLDANDMKKLSSGGDPIVGRYHSGNETEFIFNPLPILFANDMPQIKGGDNALNNRTIVADFPYCFVDNPDETNPFEKKGDSNLKDEIKTERFQSAFVMLLVNEYNKHLMKKREWLINNENVGEIYDPKLEELEKSKTDWMDDESKGSILDLFFEVYEVYSEDECHLTNKEIKTWLTGNDYKWTINKFNKELDYLCKVKRMQCSYGPKNNTKGWFNLSLKNEE